ncbi:MAG: amidohydrolase [Subtercola sp.]|nr:amidohydrolase [Subtercola sp.]
MSASTIRARSMRNEDVLARLQNRDPSTAVLLKDGIIISVDPEIGDLRRGDIVLRGTTIEAVGVDLPDSGPDTIVVDCTGMILTPGFHDTHRHSWQGALRRQLPDDDLSGYMVKIHGTFGHMYRPEDIYIGNLITALGMIDSGTTTVLDFSHNSRSAAHSDAAIKAWDDAKIRAVHASCAPMDGDWDEQWPADLERLTENMPESGLVTLRMGLLGKAVELIPDIVSLNAENIAIARRLGLNLSVDGAFGKKISDDVAALGAQGLLGPDITLIHCTSFDDDAWEAIASSGVHVSLAPTSDAQVGIANGTPPIQKCLDLGVPPTIGLDIECSLSSDFFASMRALLTIQRMDVFGRRYEGAPGAGELISDRDVLTYATINGAIANGLGDVSGSLTPGKEADILFFNSDDINLFPLNNAVASVVQAADSRNIEAVMIAGNPVKWQGEVLVFDLEEARRLAEESRDYVFDQAGIEVDVLR